jgi:hypothetical protein
VADIDQSVDVSALTGECGRLVEELCCARSVSEHALYLAELVHEHRRRSAIFEATRDLETFGEKHLGPVDATC